MKAAFRPLSDISNRTECAETWAQSLCDKHKQAAWARHKSHVFAKSQLVSMSDFPWAAFMYHLGALKMS
jgi:hypothetical protein